MANNYFQVTVTPYIPRNLITLEELGYLGACGLESEPSGNENVYLYAPDNFDTEGEYAHVMDDEGAYQVFDGVTPLQILQKVISRSNGEIPEIIIEGAFTCDKLRQGQFGGYVCRITSDLIQEGGTSNLIDWFRNNPTKGGLDANA